MRWKKTIFGAVLMAVMFPALVIAQSEGTPAMLAMEGTAQPKPEPRVTAVYGVSADDYLPAQQTVARNQLRPKVRSRTSRPSFYLPDAFYFVGGPVFILIFLRILVIFLNGFEERRKEELRSVAREVWDTE